MLVPEILSTFPIKLAEYIEQKRVSIWNSASSALCLLADRGKLQQFSFDALRLIHFSGVIMPVKYFASLDKYEKCRFLRHLRSDRSEFIDVYKVKDVPGDQLKIPIGKPFPNFEVFALTEEGELVDRPGQGELYVKSATVALVG